MEKSKLKKKLPIGIDDFKAHPVFCCSIVSPDNSGKFNS